MAAQQESLTEYLEFVANVRDSDSRRNEELQYSSYEKLILENGYWFEPHPESDVPKGQKKLCYQNTFLFVRENAGFFYCEGWAMSERLMLPMQHAWAVDTDGLVHETTWDDGCVYLGVPMDFTWVTETILRQGYYGILGNDWKDDASLLRRGFPDRSLAKGVKRA